nr:MAG TPA: hypothetical protein [Caudoviricetes sp.]
MEPVGVSETLLNQAIFNFITPFITLQQNHYSPQIR